MTGMELQSVTIGSFGQVMDEGIRARLGEILPGHVATRRWFRSKTRAIRKIEIEDVLPVAETRATVLILRIGYEKGEDDRYILPLASASGGDAGHEEVVVRLVTAAGEEGVLFSALGDGQFRDFLLRSIVCEASVSGEQGSLRAMRTSALKAECGPELQAPESFVSRAEQSNTSVIYRGRYILKLFRKLEAGVNPDLEVGRFLTEHGFTGTPAVLGSLEYRRADGEVYGAGILQQFVENRGDAWKYTLDSLGDFYSAALSSRRSAPAVEGKHPIERIGQEVPVELRTFIGDYLDSAALLGKRTAEMHGVLAANSEDPDFRPERFSREDGRHLQRELVSQAQETFALLRVKAPSLHGAAGDGVSQLLGFEAEIEARCGEVERHAIQAWRIRHHGDYHLGQVLFTGSDFKIIDFEGEPARPLAERRRKALAMRDVAGMLRSFHYAAFSALFGQVGGIAQDADTLGRVGQWAAAWNEAVSGVYLRAYFDEAGGADFMPAGWPERRILLDAFLLQKALYEVAYEMNNRPDWLQIPVRGILDLLQ